MAGPNSGELFTLLLPPTGVPVGGQKQSDGTFVPELFDANGYLLVNVAAGGGSGGTSSTFGAPFPGTGTAAGAKDQSGDMSPLLVDASGYLEVNVKTGTLSVTVTPVESNVSTNPTQTVVGTVAAQILASNAARKGFIVQNVGTTIIKLVLGAVSPTQTAYTRALPACGVANDGSSPAWEDELWTGAIQAISSATGGLLVVTELT